MLSIKTYLPAYWYFMTPTVYLMFSICSYLGISMMYTKVMVYINFCQTEEKKKKKQTKNIYWTFRTLWVNLADYKVIIFFLFFSQKIGFDILCILLGNIMCMKYHFEAYFLTKKKKSEFFCPACLALRCLHYKGQTGLHEQTVYTQIRCHRKQCMIKVYIVCQSSILIKR